MDKHLISDLNVKLNNNRSVDLIDDPFFITKLDQNASSTKPEIGVWFAQNVCVNGKGFSLDSKLPKSPGKAVIDVEFKRNHWSVLRFGFFCVHYGGYPHDAVMQLVRNSGCHLVQSFRYTGEDIIDSLNGDIFEEFDKQPNEIINHERILEISKSNYCKSEIEKYFYFQPEGKYATRDGFYYIYDRQREMYYQSCYQSCVEYANMFTQGIPSEVCRRTLKAGYRQNGVLAGTFQQLFHILDQRTLKDSQIEVRTLAHNIMIEVEKIAPNFMEFYRTRRYGKSILNP